MFYDGDKEAEDLTCAELCVTLQEKYMNHDVNVESCETTVDFTLLETVETTADTASSDTAAQEVNPQDILLGMVTCTGTSPPNALVDVDPLGM